MSTRIVFALPWLLVAALSACASDEAASLPYPPPPPLPPPAIGGPPPAPVLPPLPAFEPLPPGLLPAPPANAGPGECFAKVVVPGRPIAAPPPQPHAVWILTPAPPGGDPMWCLYFEPGVAPPPAFTPERFGWIRVLCDPAAAGAEISHVQRRLHAWGYYDGPYHGRVDGRTLSGVRRFQKRRRIDHGGYLSLETLSALEAAPEPPPPLRIAPPTPAPCGLAPCAWPGPPPGPRPDLGRPPYSPWLTWSGKSVY